MTPAKRLSASLAALPWGVGTLTPSLRLSAALATLHWGQKSLSDAAAVNDRTVRRWLAGQNDPPAELLATLEVLAAFHEAHPFPPPSRTPPAR